MLTIIAEIRTNRWTAPPKRIECISKIIPTVLAEDGCHGYEPLVDHISNASFQTKTLTLL